MKIKKTPAIYFKGQNASIDPDAGIIKNVVILQAGKDKYGDNFDRTSLTQLVELGNAQPQGVKSRFGHPNLSDSALGTYLGRFKNFSISTNPDGKEVVVADLTLDDIASRSPKGNLKSYVLEMAKTNSDMFGNSICYNPDDPEVVVEKDGAGNDINTPYERFKSFIASDLVDSPAATTSLFKDKTDFAARVTEFLDDNPDVYALVEKDEQILTNFLKKYNRYKKNKKEMSLKSIVAAKLKELGDLVAGTQKDFNLQTAEGDTVTVGDPDGDGNVMVGDMITDDEGNALPNATIEAVSGAPCCPCTITTDENGAVATITPKTSDAPPAKPAEPTQAEALQKENNALKAEVATLKANNDALVAQHTKESNEILAEIETLKAKMATIKSNGNPVVSSETQFKDKKDKPMSTEERKAAIMERVNGKKATPAK